MDELGPYDIRVKKQNYDGSCEEKVWHIEHLDWVFFQEHLYNVLCKDGSIGTIGGEELDLIIDERPEIVEEECRDERKKMKIFWRSLENL